MLIAVAPRNQLDEEKSVDKISPATILVIN